MILNMHISNDYPSWGIVKRRKKRATTLCGKITAAKYVGVPGINYDQLVMAQDGDYGWCLACCAKFITETAYLAAEIENELLASLYNNARAIAASQLRLASEVPTSPK